MAPPASTVPFRLAPGQVVLQPMAAGTCLQVLAGRLRVVEPPQWFAGHAVPREADLSDGCCHVVEQGGWVRLRALGGSEACCAIVQG